MVCSVGKILIYIPTATSLKDKRSVVKSLISRTINKFSVSCIEEDFNDFRQKALIGIVFASKDSVQADKIENSIRSFYESAFDYEVMDITFEKFTI